MQVYTVDLLKFRKEDLFTVELKPQTISVRTCEAPLRKALANGTAEYLGWLVSDDELFVNISSFDTPGIVKLREEYGPVNRWRLAGFNSNTQMVLRPLYLSKEGLKPDVDPEIKKIGLSLKDDVQQLSKRRPSLKPKNFVDLQQMAAQMGIRDMSLAKLFANFFRLRISKNAQLSNWEADALDEKQRIYAATDADACLKLYHRMQELQQTGNFQLVAPEIPTTKSTDQ